MSNYRLADTEAQWFQDNYPGSVINPNVVVLHTTEGTGWPGYGGGATAPTYTAIPDFNARRLRFRAHFPDERSSRALRNERGGVETNTLNAIQLELIGTCDPSTHREWDARGVRHVFWPKAPEWALRDLGAFLADMHKRHGIRLQAPEFLPYPQSYGNSRVRFSGREWSAFYGVCGHQHVTENSHGDPGALPIDRVLSYARGSRPLEPTRVTRARELLQGALANAKAGRAERRAAAIKDALDTLPSR